MTDAKTSAEGVKEAFDKWWLSIGRRINTADRLLAQHAWEAALRFAPQAGATNCCHGIEKNDCEQCSRNPFPRAGADGRVREALEFYRIEAEALARYMADSKENKADAILAAVTVLSLDGGNRAAKALASPVPAMPDREKLIRERADVVGNMRQSEAGLFDAKHSGQRGCKRADALCDAYHTILALLSAQHPVAMVEREAIIEECARITEGPLFHERFRGREGHNWEAKPMRHTYGAGRLEAAKEIRALAQQLHSEENKS